MQFEKSEIISVAGSAAHQFSGDSALLVAAAGMVVAGIAVLIAAAVVSRRGRNYEA